jgi:hypothetical protein
MTQSLLNTCKILNSLIKYLRICSERLHSFFEVSDRLHPVLLPLHFVKGLDVFAALVFVQFRDEVRNLLLPFLFIFLKLNFVNNIIFVIDEVVTVVKFV